MQQSVYVTRMIPESGIVSLMNAGFAVQMNPGSDPLRPEELLAEAGKHDAFVSQLADRIDRSFLQAAAPRCRIVATCAVGTDNIEIEAAREFGIAITNTPDVLTEATADLAFALLLSAARRLGEAERVVRSGGWRGWRMLDFLGSDVHGRTLGIVGAGRIGSAVAKRATGFEMSLLYYNRHPNPKMDELGARRVSLIELMEQSDFISIHTPLTPETHRLIDGRALARVKRGAILINTARGSVVDQAEMIRALRDGRLAAAGLDVYEREPVVAPELRAMENVVLLPHIGSATVSTRSRMAEMAAHNVIAVLSGRPPINPVG
ncbi:MAG: D-glycerate dehydrogenase [Phycisphaerae bacterium]|nr:D-glycerate dehydrogenase [Phycisphaerae bacterium]